MITHRRGIALCLALSEGLPSAVSGGEHDLETDSLGSSLWLTI